MRPANSNSILSSIEPIRFAGSSPLLASFLSEKASSRLPCTFENVELLASPGPSTSNSFHFSRLGMSDVTSHTSPRLISHPSTNNHKNLKA
jgi:hypothetical protein